MKFINTKTSFILLALAFSFSCFSCGTKQSQKDSLVEKTTDAPEVVYNIPQDLQEYYKEVDFTKINQELFEELSVLVTTTHTRKHPYGWEHIKNTDLTPQANQVFLIYGHQGVNKGQQAFTRGKNQNSGKIGDWNREHVFPKSLATPKLIGGKTPEAGTDAHNLRASDVQWNAARGNLPFIDSQGLSGKVAGGWYPGDQWKGDVARMIMYMYLRYPDQCLPSSVAIGQANALDPNMIDLLLQWNAQDPVSFIEIQRNNYLGNLDNEFAQGNRNPFIDNPDLATRIWAGPKADNHWN